MRHRTIVGGWRRDAAQTRWAGRDPGLVMVKVVEALWVKGGQPAVDRIYVVAYASEVRRAARIREREKAKARALAKPKPVAMSWPEIVEAAKRALMERECFVPRDFDALSEVEVVDLYIMSLEMELANGGGNSNGDGDGERKEN